MSSLCSDVQEENSLPLYSVYPLSQLLNTQGLLVFNLGEVVSLFSWSRPFVLFEVCRRTFYNDILGLRLSSLRRKSHLHKLRVPRDTFRTLERYVTEKKPINGTSLFPARNLS